MQFVRTAPPCNLTSSVSEFRKKYLRAVSNDKIFAPRHSLPLDFDVILEFINQDADPVPLHVPALGVEIKVLIMYFWNLELTQRIRFLGDSGIFRHVISTWEKYFS